MLVQIYEISSPEEARALADLGVDHIGVLVGDGAFPREQAINDAKTIIRAIPPSSKASALSLSADLTVIQKIVTELAPSILHLGASTRTVNAQTCRSAEAPIRLPYRDAKHSGC
jgi:phosphoribosylanthranilate isomerase